MTVRKVLQILRKDGWYKVTQRGSHAQYKHPVKKGRVTVPMHNGDVPKRNT